MLPVESDRALIMEVMNTMKKKIIMTSFLAASMSAAMGLTSFAGWIQDSNGWMYQFDNGTTATCGWFTDPADGSEYYIDPDGYMMSETRMEGFWLGADGRKREKTEAELQAEAARAAREASRPTPNKSAAAAARAAEAAKSANVAASTQRTHYQAEMKVFMDRIFLDMAGKLYGDAEERRAKILEDARAAALAASMANEDGSSVGDVTADFSNMYPTDTRSVDDNYGTEYSIYSKSDSQSIISSKYSKIIMKKSKQYIPQSFEMTYRRDGATSEEEKVIFDEGYRQLLVAALGENAGKAIYDQTMAGTIADGVTGNTDTENTYVISYKNGTVSIQITCSEKKATDEAAENTEAADDEEASEDEQNEAATEESVSTSSTVIVAGQAAQAEETETTEEAAEDETQAAEGENQ